MTLALIVRSRGDEIAMSDASTLMTVASGVPIAIIVAVRGRRARLGSFRAADAKGEGQTSVRLIAGPWAGQVITIEGLPTNGTALSSWTRGLVGSDVHKGHYVVTDVTAAARTAVSAWHLDE
jgi:orotate phosphoribosyltransferase